MVDETRVAPPSPEAERSQPGPIPPGTILFGVYEVLDRLGSGGMGDVYRARHRHLGSLRAIKVIHPAFAGRPEARELFFREARALLEVHHDAVVRCHDLLTGDDGRVFLVMEMVEGRSLSDWILEGALSESSVRALGARIASGLAAAHRCGVVHRDLSPDNILLAKGEPERAKLIDFGIAKILEAGDQTVVSGFKGKISYASPEQFGMFGGEVTPRSDLYALGLVLAAAASGAPLSMGATVAEAVEARQRTPSLPPRVPAGLRAEIAPLLAPDPADRPASAEGLFTAHPAGEEGARRGPPLRRAFLALLGAAAVAAAVILLPDLRSVLPRHQAPAEQPAGAPELPDSQETTGAPPRDLFDELRARLLALGPGADVAARIWTTPDPVAPGATYRVTFEANCDCAALLFSIDGSEDKIDLLYPNNHDPRGRLAPGRPLVLPSGGENPPYTLKAVAGRGEDTLKLLLLQGKLSFPPELAFFTTAQRGESLAWAASRGDDERLAELANLLKGEIWSTAETPLRILGSAAE